MHLTETQFPVAVADPAADMYAGDPATDVVSLEKYDEVSFLVHEGAGATGTATITVEECTAIDGTGATAIPFEYRVKDDTGAWGAIQQATADGFTTTAGANKLYAIRVRGRALSEDSPFVRLQLTESVDSPVVGGVVAVMSGARFAEDSMPDPLS